MPILVLNGLRSPILFSAILGLFVAPILGLSPLEAGGKDLAAYWSAAHLLSQGQNPYSPELLRQERAKATGGEIPESERPLNVWNPPWLLVALLPIGLLPFGVAKVVWLWLTIIMLGVSVSLILRLAGEGGGGRIFIWSLIAVLFFGPAISLLMIGQVSGLLLLAMVGGVYLLARGQDFWSGALLLLATSKPHITFLAVGLVGWWAVCQRRWMFFGGVAAALAFTCGLLALLEPDWLNAYRSLMGQMEASDWLSSTWWSLLESLSGKPVFRWSAFALVPLIFWLPRLAQRRGWLVAVNWALLPWLALAPYGFTFDFVLLLPALIQLIVWMARRQLTGLTAGIATASLVAIYLALFIILGHRDLPYSWTFWLPTAMFLLYAICYGRVRK